jgi:hypothetical protein
MTLVTYNLQNLSFSLKPHDKTISIDTEVIPKEQMMSWWDGYLKPAKVIVNNDADLCSPLNCEIVIKNGVIYNIDSWGKGGHKTLRGTLAIKSVNNNETQTFPYYGPISRNDSAINGTIAVKSLKYECSGQFDGGMGGSFNYLCGRN